MSKVEHENNDDGQEADPFDLEDYGSGVSARNNEESSLIKKKGEFDQLKRDLLRSRKAVQVLTGVEADKVGEG